MPQWLLDANPVIVAIISGLVSPTVLYLLGRIFNKRADDASLAGTALSVAKQAVADLKIEQDDNEKEKRELRAEIAGLKQRLVSLEGADRGPFRLTLDFVTRPPSIQSAEIRQIPDGTKTLPGGAKA